MADIGRTRAAVERRRVARGVRWAAFALLAGSAALSLAGCGGSATAKASTPKASAQPKTVNIEVIGKSDADSGAPGTFTSKEHWPAFAPSELSVPAGATVVLTVKEYDPGNTALAENSPYNAVQGGTETVDGNAVTSVANDQIAHTITIPQLGINIPLPKAPDKGFTTIVFTFKAPSAAGSYEWKCMTPCGADPNGMGGSMQADTWMRGHVVVA